MANKNGNRNNAALNSIKMQAANEVGVPLKDKGYNGDLTARQVGSVGGQMVKNMCSERRFEFERIDRKHEGHKREIRYILAVIV